MLFMALQVAPLIFRAFLMAVLSLHVKFILLELLIPEVTMLSSAVLGIWIITPVAIWTQILIKL